MSEILEIVTLFDGVLIGLVYISFGASRLEFVCYFILDGMLQVAFHSIPFQIYSITASIW